MISGENFLVRASGRRNDSCYVDYLGNYKIDDISKLTGIKKPELIGIYLANEAVYDDKLEVYYFCDSDSARRTIKDILDLVGIENNGRPILLTEAEIEFIRKALINEGVNTIHVSNKIKDSIFKKLNSWM